MPNERDEDNGGDKPTDDEPPLEEIPLSLDAMLDLLANSHRRYLLEYLRELPDRTGSFEEASKHVIRREAARTGEQPNHDSVQSMLQHVHLPKLADAGIVEYDVRSQAIRYQPNERLEALFDRIRDFEGS